MDPAPAVQPLQLAYQAAPRADAPGGRRLRVASLLVMIPALVVPFVPFACDITPAHAAVAAPAAWASGEELDREGVVLWLSTLPFLLAIPIFVWKLRRLAPIGGRLPGPGERTALIALGAVCAIAVCVVVVLLAPTADEPPEIGMLAVPALILLLAGALYVRLTATGADPDTRVSVALLGPYAANAAFCLVLWVGNAQLGWFLTLAPAAAALTELCALAVPTLRHRRMP